MVLKEIEYHCPKCSTAIREELKDGEDFTCYYCKRTFRIMTDTETGKAAFFTPGFKKTTSPLFLPKGSIRALVTIGLALCCWIIVAKSKDVPDYLLSLLLTIIGYYFGFLWPHPIPREFTETMLHQQFGFQNCFNFDFQLK